MSENKLSAAQAAALVKREVIKQDKDGKSVLDKHGRPVMEQTALLSFRDYGDYVVVVTTDGRKLTGSKK